jgi:hypothetical protein
LQQWKDMDAIRGREDDWRNLNLMVKWVQPQRWQRMCCELSGALVMVTSGVLFEPEPPFFQAVEVLEGFV